MKDFKPRHIKTIFFISLIFLCGTGLFGQFPMNLDEYTPGQLRKFAKSAERTGDLYAAIDFYEEYYRLRPGNDKVVYSLAELHRATRNYERAKDLYMIIVRNAPKKFPLAQFYYAQMLKSTGEYSEAINQFQRFRRSYRGAKDARTYNSLVRNEIEGCEAALEIVNSPLKVTVEHLNSTVNSRHVNFAPVPQSNNTLIYSSLVIDSLFYFSKDLAGQDIPVRQLYIAQKVGLDWEGGKKLPGPFNISGVETCNGAFSPDGKRFYFNRCARNWQSRVICDLYVSHLKDNKWQEPTRLSDDVNDPNYTTTQPAVGSTTMQGREVIYFVSDRPGGRGGMDIWYTVYRPDRNVYSRARNAGGRINTAGDELTPFYDFDTRTLYFSSDGLPGIGGLDIFSAMGERRNWNEPENIGYPVNSSYDDLYFTIGKDREDGFFVSNRPGGMTYRNESCCDDIYYYRWSEFIRLSVTGKIFPIDKGSDIFSTSQQYYRHDLLQELEATTEPLEDAILSLYMQDEDTKEYYFINRSVTGPDGVYFFNLLPDRNYKFVMEGFQYFNEQIHLSTEFITFSDTIEMPPIWVNILTDKPIVLENIYYEFDQHQLTSDAKNVLDTTLLQLLNRAEDIIVEVSAHTDSVGEERYNLRLSQDRANNVVQYLISKGIDSKRLVPKGYGASRPIAPNYLPDGSDNPDGREKNRRTEFQIIGTVSELDDEMEDD